MTVQLISAEQQVESLKSQNIKKVLLVEDNDANRMLLTDCLSFSGYKVKSLSDGSKFFSTVETFQPDLIVLDLKLPDIDGFFLLKEMQQRFDAAKIPVIIVSGLAFKSDCERAIGLGARRYFVKPVILTELTQAIEKELSCHQK
ncbi:response regulator with CheY-like receiver domain and winged-helix DNA-binding domain [Rivularia sp. PCC 7116]|uniref:response regulator n=1 Tax=Rivularia sp. PCC 7116 TaxID=373994 RepID=UPI00029EFAED|nr:response regulator [Rivularia sp. PCC 7116]AFY54012.1 response regulator with CheY-like receiver domain and winged-helix DNA-binding domain [Rivularia sp. PCC 7116]